MRRLLLGRQVPACTTEEEIISKRFRGEGVAARVGTLTPYHRESRSMSWKDRLAPWARFIVPTIIPGEQKKVRWLKLADKVNFPHMDEVSEASMGHITATFGHILHAPLPKPKVKGRPKTTYRRTISPVMPHPAAFTELVPQRGTDIRKHDSIVIHFMPAPGATSAGTTAPPLKLTMPFTGDEDFSNFVLPSDSTLNAPKPSFVKDLLFPEEAVDVRVERHRDLTLDIDQQSAFKEFIESSEFNLVQGRLQTPSNTRFSIPRAWLAYSGKEKAQASDETVDLPYLFGGLEIHQTVDLPWENDIILRYESIEAGQHGGTRQELSLVLDLAGRSWLGVQTSVSDLLSRLGSAVEGKYWPWSRGVAKVHELPHQNDPIWDQFKPEPAATETEEPREQSGLNESDDNPLSELFALKKSKPTPPQTLLDQEPGPVDNVSGELDSSLEAEQDSTRQGAEETSAGTSSTPESDSKPAAPSDSQTSAGPFSPTSPKQRNHLPKNLLRQPLPTADPADKNDRPKTQRRQPPPLDRHH